MLVQCFASFWYMKLITKKWRDFARMPSQSALTGPITVIVSVATDDAVVDNTIKEICENAYDPENLRIVVCGSGSADIVERMLGSGLKAKLESGHSPAIEG